jgi:pimeloyl-ACP methyl ester carboxylesterase
MTAEAAARALLARAARRTFALPGRGVEIAALDWGGDGPLVLLHHANGFCKGVWALVADALRVRCQVVAMDARGHGDSSKPEGAGAYAWDQFAADVAAVADSLAAQHGRPVALGIGNSFGGTALVGAAARRGELFARLLLVDPVIQPPPEPPHRPHHSPHMRRLVEGARRRRAHWPSRAAARAWCAERALFRAWRPEAIELYLLDGMRERADGSLELKCPGAIEAAVFAAERRLDVFSLARRVHIPTLFLWAQQGDFAHPVYAAVAASMRTARVEAVASGHLVPMEHPEIVVAAAQSLLA